MTDVDRLIWHNATCHCASVQVRVQAPADIVVHECNCSICSRLGYLHLVVPATRFEVVKGGDQLTRYQFNTRIAQHLFCRTCGVKVYYVPRSNPDGFSVNARCLDRASLRCMTIEPFDGRNWEANAGALASLSASP